MENISPILEVIRKLRGEGGCPWDKKQTPVKLWKCLAEELYELEEGLAKSDLENTCEELGDVLFLVLFIMDIFNQSGDIPFSKVVNGVTQKMIRRHPHVYGNAKVSDKKELMNQWERIKADEKLEIQGNKQKSALDKVPHGMPGLVRAMKVSKEAAKEGFDWDDMEGVLNKVFEEIQEFEEACKTGTREEAMLEFGDILFSMVNVARFAGFHPEMALACATAKFEQRFCKMEKLIAQKGLKLNELSQAQKDKFWSIAKEHVLQE